MTDLSVQSIDLPDEILLHIFKKLHNIEILYFLIDVNQRLNRIICDPSFTSHLALLTYWPDTNSVSSFPDVIVDRFCSKILPRIGHQIKSLSLERISMECILRAANYPNLYELCLYNVDDETAKSLFIDDNLLSHIYKDGISTFSIDFTKPDDPTSREAVYTFIFTQILMNFTNLKCLRFNPDLNYCDGLYFSMSPLTVASSTLLELHVCVHGLTDCLRLLDGRFDQLRACYVTMITILPSPLATEHKNKLIPNLQFFSLTCTYRIYMFELVVSLLHRMINLEILGLDVEVSCNEGLIDGHTLQDIISHMPRLHQFLFNIYSTINHFDQTDLPSNEYIQNTFEDFLVNHVITCVDHFEEAGYSQCHIYSAPYQSAYYNNITNNFPGGFFPNVTEVSLYDERPFEYVFFVRLAQAFPLMKILTIKNEKAQNDKEFMKSNNNNQTLSIIEYPNLSTLHVWSTHDDYIELFLLDEIVSLPNNVHLFVHYESLVRVTNNFTRDATRNNCEKFSFLRLYSEVSIDDRIKNYFSHAYSA